MSVYDPFFPVLRKPANVIIDNQTKPIGKDVLINGKTGEILSTVSENYSLVTNEQVNDLFMDTIGYMFQNITIKDNLSARGGKWVREIILNDAPYTYEIDKKDSIKIKINLFNSYDRNASIGFELSGYRLICKNGMMGWRRLYGQKYRHLSPDIIENMVNAFYMNFDNFYENIHTWQKWATLPYPEKKLFRLIDTNTDNKQIDMNESTSAKLFTQKESDRIKILYQSMMDEYNENETKWGTYNALMAVATHHTKARKGAANIFSNQYKKIFRLARLLYNDI